MQISEQHLQGDAVLENLREVETSTILLWINIYDNVQNVHRIIPIVNKGDQEEYGLISRLAVKSMQYLMSPIHE